MQTQTETAINKHLKKFYVTWHVQKATDQAALNNMLH